MKRLYPPQWVVALIAIFSFVSSSALATTFTVTNLNDSGAGSLRQSIIDANAAGAGPHTINFAVAGTIPINSSLPAIANSGITIDGGGTITINAQGGDIDRRFFIIQASNTTVKGFTLQNTGTYCFDVSANLSNVTIEDIIANHVSAVMDNVVLVTGASTNMTIKNVMVLSGMQGCAGNNVGRPLYFQNGLQTNLLIEDVTLSTPCEGIVFRDASVNNLDILNATIYGSINHIVLDNTGGPVETANDVTIDGENTASLYSQADGGSAAMIYSDFVNTTWQIKNITIDGNRANTTDDGNYGIRFDNTTNGITIDNVQLTDIDIYPIWFNGAATNITISNSSYTIPNIGDNGGTQAIRFENTVTTLNINNVTLNMDQPGTTDDSDYGIVFAGGWQKTGINITNLTINEADGDGIYFDGPATNFTMTASTFTNNYDGIEFYNGYNHSNLNITNSTFTGHNRSAILINTGSATNSGTISGNNISNNTSNGLWFYSGDGNKAFTVSSNTISYNGGAGIYVNAGPDKINITQNSIFRNTGNGIELDGGGNLSYEGTNRPTITGSSDLGGGMWQVNVSLPTICNAAGGCTVEVFANASSDDVEGHYFVQSFSGLAAGSHMLTITNCTAIPCAGFPYGFWTSNLKVANTGSVSEFSNKQSMKTQGPGAVNSGVALWLDAQDALSGNLPGGTGWQDRSGNDRDFTTVGSDPNRSTGGLNYNHYVQFDGDDAVWRPSFTTGFTAGEVFAVTRGYYRHANSGPPFDMGGFSGWNAHYTWSNQVLYEPFGTTDPFAWNPVNKAITDGKTGLTMTPGATTLDTRSWNIYQVGASSSVWQTGFNGVTHATTATNTPQFLGVGGNPNNHIGWRGYYFYGDVAEVVFYSRVLTPTERQKVQSYLALKYGTTLDQGLGANNYIASNGSNMWVNDSDGYRWNIFGIGRDDDSGLQQKQSESIEQNAILSVAMGNTIAATNEANATMISTDRSFLTFADNNQLQRFGPAVSATNSNFRMHRIWKVDKTLNWSDANVTFKFGEDFAGNYLIIASDAGISTITSELQLDANGSVTFSSNLLAHNSYFTVGAKMQLPGCVAVPSVSYPNYQEYYNAVAYPFLGAGGIGYGYNTNPATQANENNITYSGYYGRNFTNSFACDNCIYVYRAKFTAPTNGNYTFYLTSDDNADLRVNGNYVAGVVTCCYTNSGTISLNGGTTYDIEVRQAEGGGGDYVTVEYSGPSIGRQVIPVTALTSYTAPGVQTWLKADAGVVTSGTVTRWNDVSGNNNDAYQTNAAYNPTYNSGNAINFNPSVATAGSQGMLFKKTIPSTNDLQVFAVGKYPTAATRTLMRGSNVAPVADHFVLFHPNNTLSYYDNNNVGWKYSGQTATVNVPYLIGMSHNAAANTAQPRLNGKNGTVLTNINEADVDYFQNFMNWIWQGGDQPIGDVSEFIAVSGTLSPTDIQKIESYLALKYGITIDQTTTTNYLATTGTMWVNDNDGYIHDIAGIGKDDCQDLHQKQSKSVNGDDPITIAIGDTILPTNAANATSVVNDLSFLTWANNDGNTTNFTTAVSVAGIQSTTRIARIWKVDKTNWNNTPNLTINFQGANDQFYLLISNDPTFATGVTEYQLNDAGNRTFPAAALAHGAYFTFGKRVAGPGCVNTGIALWLRADDGTATGALWADYSGNQRDAVQANAANQPAVLSSGMNFNPAFNFDAAINKFLQAPSVFGTGALTNAYVFLASTADGVGNGNAPFGERINNGQDLNAYIYNGGQVYWDFPYGWRINTAWGGTVGIPNVWTFGRTTTLGSIARDGRQITSAGGNFAGLFGTNNAFEVGRRLGGTYYHGKISEIVVYTSQPSAAEQKRIESYLALKYGVTLDQTTATNYVASDGTVYWDGTVNSAYNDDVAGIGRDDCTNLNQKQSKSVNSDAIITMAVGTSLAASNAANATTITNDKSFLLWSNNDGATTFSPSVTGFANATTRMSRIWKVDKHNFADQDITICASQSGERYLLLSADATFGAGDVEKTFDFSTGCVTLNSSELGDGSYFTIATRISGPACVNAGVIAWLRADYGVNGSSWADYSGNSNHPTATSDPDTSSVYINFNRAYYYDGNDVHTLPVSANLTTGNYSIMTVSRMEGTQNGRVFGSSNGDNKLIGYWGGYEDQLHLEGWLNGPYGTLATTNTKMYSLQRASTGSGPWEFRDANRVINSGASSNGSAFRLSMGAWRSDGAEASKVYIPEVAVYNTDLAPADVNKIESYFALKYGITLNQTTPTNYVASNGSTVMWNATINTGYNANIAGIGRDDCTNLNQKQSKSVNTGEILTGALGSTVAASNAANANTITTDNSFLVWGNNNGLNEFTTQVTGTNVTSVLGRVWRVDKTNWTDQNITLCFDNYNNDDYLVISNLSPTFATINQEKQLSSLGCVTFNSSELPDGAYFSIGKNIMAPGCVTGGIVTWLDAQTAASGNMIDGVGWSDQSGNNKYFNWVFGDPARTDAALNYNHVINFDGNDYLRSTQSPFVNNFTAGEVLVITKSAGQYVNQGNPYDFGSGNRNEHYSWSNSYLYNAFGTTDSYVYNPENNVVADNKAGAPNPATGTFYTETNWNLYHTYSAPNDWGTGFNGLFKATSVTNTTSFALAAGNEHVGASSGYIYGGDIAEVILYRRKLTATERQKVMSYLALKYGMTLDTTVTDQDYVAADGTIFWDWADNNNYQHDIAGIGRDDCQQLHQKQSKSINGDDPLAIAVGNFTTFPTSNEANTATIADDESFLVWSNNNGASTFTTGVPKLGINATFHTPRKWRISKTSFTDQMLTISVGQSGERYLLVDEDGSGGFENDANTKEYAFDFTTGLLNISSLNLPDGAVITLGTKISGPACVNSGIDVWLRADYGATGAQWTDFSGNNRSATQPTMVNQPSVSTSTMNFNPAFDFNGSNGFMNLPNSILSNTIETAHSIFFAINSDLGTDKYVLDFNNGNDISDALFGASGGVAMDQQPAGSSQPLAAGGGVVVGVNVINGSIYRGDGVGGYTASRNGRNTGSQAASNAANGTINLARVGLSDVTGYYDGKIGEVIIYNREITSLEKQRIESYLALKYGITLTTDNDNDATAFEVISGSVKEGDYVASDGTTIYWDGFNNTGYNTNVAGIGLDICTELSQKQSKSVNTGEILTGALGSAVATSNAANVEAFDDSDLSFLVWGHNNGTNDFSNTVTAMGTTSMAYLGRVWRAQKTNFSDQNITLCFTGYDADEYLLISNSSATFATVNQELQLDANGCITFSSALLQSGAYFTLGKNIQGPACVDGGIKLWLRADDGLVTDSSWVDYSGNGRTATQATSGNRPIVSTTNGINFNPTLIFDNANDNLAIPSTELTGLPIGNESRTAFYVGYLNTNSGEDFAFSYGYEGLTNQSFEMGHTGGNAWYESWGAGMLAGAATYPAQRTLINMWRHDNTVNPSSRGHLDNKQIVSSNLTLATSLGVGAADPFYIGRHNHDAAPRYWDGKISEVIIYNRALSATEVQQVNSYLALKYGITIDQTVETDYIASDGSNIWNATDNGAYKVDIAGIGKDICTNLDQKQSKSVNANSLITIALGNAVAATNAANPNTITNDKSFLVWANNGLATTFTTGFTKTGFPNVNQRTPRIWKVDKTNWADQDITICVNQTGERYLLIDNGLDADFADDGETSVHALSFSTGCVTINSSLLPDGAHFSLGTEISGPACVNTGIKTWYRTDYGATVSNWGDYSGNSNTLTQSTTANQPDLNSILNFNQVMDFNPNDFMSDANGIFGNTNYTSSNVFVVQVNDQIGISQSTLFENTANGQFNVHLPWSDNNVYWDAPLTNRIAGAWGSAVNVPNLWSLTSNAAGTSVTTGRYVYRNRTLIPGSTATAPAAFTGNNSPFYLGSGPAVSYSNIKIAEIAVYGGQITDVERLKIESYFSLKYGLTLDQTTNTDYVASNWNGTTGTKMWTNDNDGFETDIAGIGKDECTNLHQKQSASVNTGNILTVALGSAVEATNAANANSITNDLSFLSWAHNNGTLDFTTTAPGLNATARLARVWKVDKTNWADQNVTICFGATYANNYLITNNTDATFPTVGLEYQLDANGCYTLNSSDLPDGTYFTIGKNLEGPACVNGGIKVWLRADDGSATGAAWNDYSGNVTNFAQANAGLQAVASSNSMNFNPGLTFTNDDIASTATTTTLNMVNSDYEIIGVGKSTASHTNIEFPFASGVAGYYEGHTNGGASIGWRFIPDGSATDIGTNGLYTNTIPHIFGGKVESDAGLPYVDGKLGTTPIAGARSTVSTTLKLGRRGDNSLPWTGDVSEYIVYNRALSATERQKVQSYLALKYGITLDMSVTNQDYIASDGTNMWDWSDNVGYRSDVAGLGKDDCTGLHQKQSKSVNANSLVSIATGSSVAATNAANSIAVTNDKSFFVWGNNGLGTTFTLSVSGLTNTTARTPRVWKVDKTNWQDQDITICVNQSGERYLLINTTDPAFGAGTTEYSMNFSTGCVTINSSLLPDGAYFSLGTKITGPACVNAGIKTWLRADYGATGAQWTDFSGNNNSGTQATVANQPALQPTAFNYNPGFDFDGTDFYDVNLNLNPLTTDPVTLIAVYETDAINLPVVSNVDAGGGFDRELFTNGVASDGTFTSTPSANLVGVKTLNIAALDDGAANGSQSYVNGLGLGTFTHANAQGGLTITKVGKNGDLAAHFNGRMAEVVIYNAILSDADRKKVESYLAIKYGITLDQTTATDYVASNGTTLMWDASDNAGYTSNIAGIGKDDCTELHQKQSKSVNSGEILSVGLGSSIATSNAANTNSVTNDQTFFTWGNNNGSTDFLNTVTATSTTSMAYMGRVWKVDKSSTTDATSPEPANWIDQDITLCFTGYDQNSYLLISNSSSTFATIDQEFQLGTDGCYTLNSSLIPDGAYFTLGKVQQGPACVDGGIAAWFRIDQGITQSGTISNWADQSGNGVDVSQATSGAQPTYQVSTLMNFHPTASYDGGDVLRDTLATMVGNQPYTIFAIHKPNNVASSLFAIGNPSTQNAIAYHPQYNLGTRLLYHYNDDLSGGTPRFDWQLNTFQYDALTSGTDRYIYDEGKLIASGAANLNLPTNPIFSVGGFDNRTDVPNGNEYSGQLVEFVVYEKALNAAERNRVESYLALKYGITLDQTTNTDYIASDGTTFMWQNDSDNFENDIAGIGKDICTGLDQKQSKSINTDDLVTFGLGASIATSNAANASTITNDKSFFSWANDNGATATFGTAVTTSITNVDLRMARVWKVDKTANWADQDVTLCFAGQIGERYLVIDDNSSTLASVNTTLPLDPFTGCITLNTSNFQNGYYFGLATKILAPGCADNTDVLTWLRGDYAANANQWNDFSGQTRHAQQTTLANQPATGGIMNFNPAMDFTGNAFLTFDIVGQSLNINPTVTDRDPITVLSVYNADVTSRPIWGNDDGFGDRLLYMDRVADGTGEPAYSGGNVTGQNKLITTVMDEGTTNGSYVYADGAQVLNFTQSGSDGGLSYNMLGRNWTGQGSGAMFDGRIGEFVVYRGILTATERQQAESYLVLKYGITLNSGNTDYLASDGTTIMWDASDNTGYNSNIAGIGRDDCPALEQKQSRSVNTTNSGNLLTVALGATVETTNAANIYDITNDLSFFTWGDNNGALSLSNVVAGTNATTRMSRVWKADKTANWGDQDITLCFNGYDDNFYLLVSNSSATFATIDVEQQLNGSGCITINTALIQDGAFFTLGQNLRGPACVNTDIAMWLRADDGATVSAWNDFSGNELNATQGTSGNQPTVNASAVNFNPALVFDGTDDYMSLAPLNKLPYGATARTILSVGYSSNTVGNRWLFSYGTAGTSQANFWGQQGTTGNYGGYANDVTSASYWTTNIPNLTANTYTGSSATIYQNGKALTPTAKTWNTLQNKGYIGRQVSDTEYWQGGIGEVIVYNRVLNATELQAVHSYLALKYGITLDQTIATDYVASDNSVIWNATTNATYKFNIAGIGQDDCGNLLQKQSKSINTGARLTMGLGTIEATNAANTGVFGADKSFLIWGDDNGAFTEIMTDLPTAFAANTKRFTREWKVDRTGSVGTVQLQFDLSSLTVTGSSVDEFKLLIDRDGDGDFTTGTVDVVDASGYVASTSVTFDNVTLNDGDVFTLSSFFPNVTLSVKVFLQGAALDATPGLMRNSLQTFATDNPGEPDILPTTDPYTGTATYASIHDPLGAAGAVVDWVEIQIRSVADPNVILERKSLLLQTDGDVVDALGGTPTFTAQGEPVYIVVRHRNHIAIVSTSIASFSGAVSYDFTTAASQGHKFDPIGDLEQQVLINGKWCMWAGDAFHEGSMDANDLSVVNVGVVNATFSQYLAIDTYMDGVLDANDLGLTTLNVNNALFSSLVGAGFIYPN